MKKYFVIVLLAFTQLLPAQQIPAEITYCGISISLTPDAQEKLATSVAGIYESPRYYNAMVQRSYTYMPFIEEALRKQKAPLDLKYLAIQESSLKGDAVSSSNAVGYWQFKEPVAREFELRIDRQIDERRHIYRSSEAAASYFIKANQDFDNYVYAVIAYYEGLTGAVPYTNPEYYGKREMIVDGSLHWYVMKAIAHKIAYADALSMEHEKQVWLEPAVVERGASLADLSAKHGVEASVLLEYNPWILDERRLPSQPLTYYIPHLDSPYPGHSTDPVSNPLIASESNPTSNGSASGVVMDSINTPEASTNPRPRPLFTNSVLGPPAQPAAARPVQDYAIFSIEKDLHYDQEFTIVKPGDYLNDVADRTAMALIKILNYNNLRASQMPEPGTVIYLKKLKKRLFHIVEEHETIGGIAAEYGKSIKKLQKLNNMAKEDLVIYVGQKLHVKKRKDREERMIILQIGPQDTEVPELDESLFVEEEEVVGVEENQAPAQDSTAATEDAGNEEPEEDFDGPNTEWVEHTVQPGETLWRISQAYGTKVDIIKLVNKLESDSISPGTTLRILANKDKLEAMNN
jgi:membrane-bound lytic murein transglycosylase D